MSERRVGRTIDGGASSRRLRRGRIATVDDLRRAQEQQRLLGSELSRVRELAGAWRNGLAGLITALVTFSLIRGRSDIGTLSPNWAVAVGVLLLLALVAGGAAAILVLRAAHGRPRVVELRSALPEAAATHAEALRSARAVQRGIVLSFVCLVLLTGAVATTWYGPEKSPPGLRIRHAGGTVCGRVVEQKPGWVTVEAAGVRTTVQLSQASFVVPVSAC
ncbi:hypothetical protein [Streptomyces sp. NBC_01443]|uniref:hypothetical protein n=1 Tax=Streptomyces sp. NBC_01443 TaxID=2903868 RepID=UPI002254BE26|nr:hypothetical protein [Streptomyces sp. NBC_01443]MCX4632926.1 hypothetical protein [Streptomyces sp. NBC_01443]